MTTEIYRQGDSDGERMHCPMCASPMMPASNGPTPLMSFTRAFICICGALVYFRYSDEKEANRV